MTITASPAAIGAAAAAALCWVIFSYFGFTAAPPSSPVSRIHKLLPSNCPTGDGLQCPAGLEKITPALRSVIPVNVATPHWVDISDQWRWLFALISCDVAPITNVLSLYVFPRWDERHCNTSSAPLEGALAILFKCRTKTLWRIPNEIFPFQKQAMTCERGFPWRPSHKNSIFKMLSLIFRLQDNH